MANETTLVLKRSEPIDFIVVDGTAVEKGTIMKFSGPRSAAASASADIFAGIARREKIAVDGRARLSLFTGPGDIFIMTAVVGDDIAAGEAVALSGPNLIRPAVAAELLTGKAFGTALEDISGEGTGEVMLW